MTEKTLKPYRIARNGIVTDRETGRVAGLVEIRDGAWTGYVPVDNGSLWPWRKIDAGMAGKRWSVARAAWEAWKSEQQPEPDEPLSRRDHLLAGFLGEDIKRVHLYNTSPSFQHAIETLVAMAPAWVDGLAAHAEEQDRHARQLALAMERDLGILPLDLKRSPSDD